MKKFIPDIYQKNIYVIDYSKLLASGINTLLFDLDNTIISSKTKEMPEKAKTLFISLKQKGFKIIIFSNSPKKKVNKYNTIRRTKYEKMSKRRENNWVKFWWV